MVLRLFVGMACVAVLLTGCDVKPPKPETAGSTLAGPAAVDGAAAATGERSLRLHGPGVSRHRQIRV